MSFVKLIPFLLFPLFICASSLSTHYADSLMQRFQEGNFSESLHILEEWETFEPELSNKINGMRAAVYLSVGNFEKGRVFMDQFIQSLSPEECLDPLLGFVLELYYKAFPVFPIECVGVGGMVRLCHQEQPAGVKLKYWFGVGQVLVGILAAPFSAGTSLALVLSGAAMVVDASADALNNKESWERELNERQRTNPDVQRNSFFYNHFNEYRRCRVEYVSII